MTFSQKPSFVFSFNSSYRFQMIVLVMWPTARTKMIHHPRTFLFKFLLDWTWQKEKKKKPFVYMWTKVTHPNFVKGMNISGLAVCGDQKWWLTMEQKKLSESLKIFHRLLVVPSKAGDKVNSLTHLNTGNISIYQVWIPHYIKGIKVQTLICAFH